MKPLLLLLIPFLLLLNWQSGTTPSPPVATNELDQSACENNPDERYDREKILEKLVHTLNASAPGYLNYKYGGFKLENQRPVRFFVYDLTDLSNKGTPLGPCVKFVDKHVYHFAGMYIPYSFSHILFLKGGNTRIFYSLNCTGGDSLPSVINYLKQELAGEKDKDEVLNRVQDYRQHGMFVTTDDTFIRCAEMKRP